MALGIFLFCLTQRMTTYFKTESKTLVSAEGPWERSPHKNEILNQKHLGSRLREINNSLISALALSSDCLPSFRAYISSRSKHLFLLFHRKEAETPATIILWQQLAEDFT